jgi:hypothetical protein
MDTTLTSRNIVRIDRTEARAFLFSNVKMRKVTTYFCDGLASPSGSVLYPAED